MRKKSLGWILLIIIVGALLGSALGEVLGLVLPQGVVRDFFLRSAEFGFGPALVNLAVLTFTIGFSIKLNIIGILGIAMAAYFLRWIQ